MSCCLNPANNPNAIEYGKAYKPKNNAGCCGCGGCNGNSQNQTTTSDNTTVVRTKKTRADYS